ncbi:IS3 family transposase [Legionella lytica]|uniref:IS3 family transposase n=1 Tax=Legionella lytica TaxID=96232 RepID=A0ABY4Y6L4_9GAMM|nr:IS3 family transposase [Legionella lytica]
MVYGVKYKTRKDAQLALFDYIEVFYINASIQL